MKILAIETSADETAISLVDAGGTVGEPISFAVLGSALSSQIAVHREFQGIHPSFAKREHARNLVPLLQQVLAEAGMFEQALSPLSQDQIGELKALLEREPELFVLLISFLSNIKKPSIDALAVTTGPGLEPALWVGVNFARALGIVWDLPVIPVNHMEGHVLSSLITERGLTSVELPLLALLISGGHTQLVSMKEWGRYAIIGETRDDAAGEAFDKVARMLGLLYPGGPEISRLAQAAREGNLEQPYALPRPMIDSVNLDFSFSGLKTAVLYLIRDEQKRKGELTDDDKKKIAREFEDAVADVLLAKARKALKQERSNTFVIGGGVAANKHIRYTLETHLKRDFPALDIHTPPIELTGDNAIMIAAAAYVAHLTKRKVPKPEKLAADGNLSLS